MSSCLSDPLLWIFAYNASLQLDLRWSPRVILLLNEELFFNPIAFDLFENRIRVIYSIFQWNPITDTFATNAVACNPVEMPFRRTITNSLELFRNVDTIKFIAGEFCKKQIWTLWMAKLCFAKINHLQLQNCTNRLAKKSKSFLAVLSHDTKKRKCLFSIEKNPPQLASFFSKGLQIIRLSSTWQTDSLGCMVASGVSIAPDIWSIEKFKNSK